MYRFNTKADLLSSTSIQVGISYLAPDSNGDDKEWIIKTGTPPDGTIANLVEPCTGIASAYAFNISGSFSNGDQSHLSVLNAPINTQYYDSFNDTFWLFDGATWRTPTTTTW